MDDPAVNLSPCAERPCHGIMNRHCQAPDAPKKKLHPAKPRKDERPSANERVIPSAAGMRDRGVMKRVSVLLLIRRAKMRRRAD